MYFSLELIMRTHFSKFPVKLKSVHKEREVTAGRITTRTVISEHQFNEVYRVAYYPAFDPEVTFRLLQDSYKDKVFHVSGLVMYIQTQVYRKEQSNVIPVHQQELAEMLQVSIGTINKAVQYLEMKGLLTKVKQSMYKVSPRLAFIGDHVHWAEALKEEATGIVTEVTTEILSDN
jgi:predicted transcriptional regulator